MKTRLGLSLVIVMSFLSFLGITVNALEIGDPAPPVTAFDQDGKPLSFHFHSSLIPKA
jgi:hypothetical protein